MRRERFLRLALMLLLAIPTIASLDSPPVHAFEKLAYWCSSVDVDNHVAYYSDPFLATEEGAVGNYPTEFYIYVRDHYHPTGRMQNQCKFPNDHASLSQARTDRDFDADRYRRANYDIEMTGWTL